ncbi:MAG TPA: trimethylamine methyltransferase family protein [Anaerolineales bacterium]|nr:trimethylamine methyltransferase family protein [Anaerolineales bacterium]
MIANFAAFLTQVQVERVHQASLEILSKVGMLVRNQRARQIFAAHGCQVDPQTEIVKLPMEVVEHYRRMFTPGFTFYGRDPRYDRTIPDDSPLILTGSSAPNIIDPVTGLERRARSDDLARISHLINELPGYDVFSISTLADDAPPGQFSLSRFYPSIKNTVKPVRANTPPAEAEDMLRLAYLVAGGEAAFRERPFITFHYCPVVSPLTMDFDSTELLIFFAERDLPSYFSIVPNAGLTSPLTMSATLAQCNAEFLAAATLTQMIQPGKALIYSTLPTVADMRTGAYSPGAIETGMLHMGCAQMARFYNITAGGYIGLTNSKINDAQSGYETGMSVAAGYLGGVDIFNMGGLLDALMAFDFAKAVIDGEIAMMLKRMGRGFEFSEAELALDQIAEIGPGGMFAGTEHTLERMRSAMYLADIADRDPRAQWQERGGLDTQGRAMRKAREILSRQNPAAFSPELDALIRAEFPGVVAGEAEPPEGWKRIPPESESEEEMGDRRRRRRHLRGVTA